jgi:hypothetical protein
MARPSQLEGRVLAILDTGRNRRPPARWVRAAMGTAAIAMILPIGALRLTAADGPAVTRAAVIGTVAPVQAALPATRATSSTSAQSSSETSTRVDAPRVAAEPARITQQAPAADSVDHAVEHIVDQVVDNVVDSLIDALPYFDFNFDFNIGPDPHPNPEPAGAQGSPGDTGLSDETRRRVADALIAALNDENADVREEALTSLATMRDPRAIPGLVKTLRDPMADLRERAVDALAQFNTQEAVDGIVSALKDANAGVRERAARALGRITRGQRRAVPPTPPGVPKPSLAPAPPRPPQVRIDEQAIRETVARVQEKAQRFAEEVQRKQKDIEQLQDEFERRAQRVR